MSDDEGNRASNDDVARRLRLFAVCQEHDADWKAGRKTPIEEFLRRLPEAEQPLALEELVAQEFELRRVAGDRPDLEEYLQRFPQHSQIIRRALAEATVGRLSSDKHVLQAGSGVVMHNPPESLELPLRIDRYEFVRKLGGGTYGLVGHYHDTETGSDVALKIPKRRSSRELERFFQEARHQAAFRSTGIVSIYDVQRNADPPFIVLELMAGGELTALTRDEPVPWDRVAQVVAEVAEALEDIHKRGYIHRDLKPANVLLDAEGHPRIADCGLVMHVGIREQIRGEFAGSQAYMSPEQLRCEDIDARSDLWSLGVIFYELLTRKHPFEGLVPGSLRQSILTAEPPPPGQHNPRVPAELQRICLRMLEKRPDDRYSSAAQVARDLESWRDVQDRVASEVTTWSGVPPTLASLQADHSQLFLQLTPGPRERDGTPTSLQFWKTRIESTDPELAFRLGALFGKSGSGKSSLLRAGLLPSLGAHVTARLVEATSDDTEVRLLKSLRQQYPALTEDLDLVQSLALLREELIGPGQKLLLVVDQFEQWLHGWNGQPEDQLPAALRQCDGVRLQCLLTIRDDFFLSLTRLLREVGVKPQEHVNTMAVDLFDRGHARKVLASYGQALGAIGPEATAEQNEFLQQAVEQLSEEQGRIVCVRLVMLAQMMAGRSWTVETLNDLGGLDELGIKFLDELIHGDSAPPQRRAHATAIDCVLAELVPPRGTDIKQRMRSWDDLLAACPAEYRRETDLFDEVLEILRKEIRLITPTEPDVAEAGNLEHSAPPVAASEDPATPKRFYQLTHDYLVFPLRERRARRERKTLRGRARLRLRELADLSSGGPADQFLPRWWEDLFLRAFTSARQWNDAERRMMRRSGWKHGRNAAGILLVTIVAGWVGIEVYRRDVHQRQRQQMQVLADGQLNTVLNSELAGLEDSLGALEPHVDLVEGRLRDAMREPNPRTFRNALLAHALLLGDVNPWTDARMLELLFASPLDDLELILDMLSRRAATDRNPPAPKLWDELASVNNHPSRRLRAAATLATISP
ncbi:MAG: protein kinase, partial [Pirellulaceae bacterium]|nr:protein kinase [Pirellulaceae bacterium]